MAVDKAGLAELWSDIAEHFAYKHLQGEASPLVPGVGSEQPWAFVVGQNPGAEESRRRLPFVGASGRVLHQLMDLAGMYAYPRAVAGSDKHPETSGTIEPNVWLTNAVKFMTPGNRPLNAGEIIHATEFLRREYKLVGSPRLIVLVGSQAAQALGIEPIPRRGDIFLLKGKTYFCCQYHPAYGMRGDDRLKERIEEQWEQMAAHIEEMRDELQAY